MALSFFPSPWISRYSEKSLGMEEGIFQKDLDGSKPITLAEWKTRSPVTRVKEFVARFVEYWL